MSSVRLQRSSSIGAGVRGHTSDFHSALSANTLTECEGDAFCMVFARSDEAFDRFKSSFGVELPRKPGYVSSGTKGAICVGPKQWLVYRERSEGMSFERDLISSLGDSASVFDQTGGRAHFRISGPTARQVLTKGVLLDLHPSEFGPGSAASTAIAYMGVTVWQRDDKPTYDLLVFRSFAESLWDWILGATKEFGVIIAPVQS